MINFYETWKHDKESNPKKAKAKPANQCRISDKRVNGLKQHVEDVHRQGMWARYVAVELAIQRRNLDDFRKLL